MTAVVQDNMPLICLEVIIPGFLWPLAELIQ